MSTPATAPEPTATLEGVPRILLFGHPGSGKSSLLGALLQASDVQPERLEAEVTDPGRRLELLRDAVYHGADTDPGRTPIVTHLIHVRPLATEGEPVPEPYPIVILDCDGAAANALLKHPDPLTDPVVHGPVAHAVVETDVLILAVNAGADDAQLRRTFDDFLIFLERVQGRKAFAREVGGFPIVLALTQCDRLAAEGDTTEAWETRVAGRLEDLLVRLREYLEEASPEPEGDSPYLPFGSVELKGYAVALRRPETADDPDPPDEPYGVAELFRDCFADARAHRERAISSDLRLWWTVRSVLFAVGVMLLALLGVLAFQPASRNLLADRVEEYRAHEEPPPEVRLAAKNITRTERTLRGFSEDPGFDRLPEDLRKFVIARLEEIEKYRAVRASLDDPGQMVPAEARTKAQLDAIRARLNGTTFPPEWAHTEAAEQRAKWLDDIQLIEATVRGWSGWYWLQAGIADSQARTATFDAFWLAGIEQVVRRGEHPRVRDVVSGSSDASEIHLEQPVPGSRPVLGPRDRPVTFGTTYWFEQSSLARDQWTAARDRLLDLRGLADALALTPAPAAGDTTRPLYGVLFVPSTGAGPPLERVERLEKHSGPNFNPVQRWRPERFEDPARSRLVARLEESRKNATDVVQADVRAKLGPEPEAEKWRRLADRITADPQLQNWGRLLHVLARLRDPTAADPVAELVAFLRKDRFEIAMGGFELRIPDTYQLRGGRVVPDGPLTVTAGSPVRFKLAGKTDVTTAVIYQFVPEGDGKLAYRPGDELRVAIPVRLADGQSSELVWDTGGPPGFQFERLKPPLSEPKLRGESQPAPGVKLTPLPAAPLPTLPALFPR
jgi:hypothetical protein